MRVTKKKSPGISLVETLVSMALLGVIFIPLLFVSSAVFLGQLVQMREQVDVSHGSSRFLSGFMRDLQHARRVLPQSDSDNLYLAYFDPVRQREMTVHYQIAASDHLRKFIQNTMTGNWDEVSPYGTLEAGEIDLTSSGTLEFAYCLDTDCSGSTDVSAEPERAVLVQLKDWVFTQGDQSLALPELNVYVSTDSQAGSNFHVSDEVRELYSFDATVPFGAGVNYRLVNLTPTGGHFNHVAITTTSGSPGLTTIITNQTTPGLYSIAADANGRVFFGEDVIPGQFWTWHEDTGLSILIPSDEEPGVDGTFTAPDGRVFIGGDENFYTWHEDTGLTLIVSNAEEPGDDSVAATPDGRVFFGEDDTAGTFRTWHKDTGLTVIVSGVNSPGKGSVAAAPDGRVFFGEEDEDTLTPGFFYTWHKDTGLSTILPAAVVQPGIFSSAASTDGRVFFGQDADPGSFWTWHKDTGLSTLVSGQVSPGLYSTAVDANGRVFFGEDDDPGQFWTWHEDTGLSILVSGGEEPGVDGTAVASDGRVFFGSDEDFYTWREDTGLSIVVINQSEPGDESVAVSPGGRVFFGEDDPAGTFWTWHEDTGLTTIVSGVMPPGKGSATATPDGRVFFGEEDEDLLTPGLFWTWHENTGLSTILPSATPQPGFHSTTTSGNEWVFFGQDTDPGSFWAWWSGVGTATTSLGRSTATGAPTNQGINFEQLGANYIAATQAAEGDFYLVNTDDDKLDRYTYNTVAKRFERKSQLPLGSWAANVGAVVTDQANDDVALLDTVGQKIYVYGDRTATSGSPTVYDSGNGFDFAVSPTGLAINQRTGDYLVIDSDVTGSAGNERIKLYVVDLDGDTTTASREKTFFIEIGASGNLSDDLSGETNFKIQYDEAKNILYLMAPSTDTVYALMLPAYL